jgi:flagella basal body P-ring formation protein FlgA
MNVFLPALAAALVSAVPAAAATLRVTTTLSTGVVRLADLFDDAGPRADRVLGPGPLPGGRIVVEAPQLAAIARQFGVDWRPGSPADRAVLDRPGRLLPREQVLDTLRAALADAGAPADGDLDLPGFGTPMVPLEGSTGTAIEQLDYDASSGRFTAVLAVTAPAMPVQRMRLSGRLAATVAVPVLTRRLPAGAVLQPGDVETARVRAGALRGDAIASPAAAVGLALRRVGVAGQPLDTEDLVRPAVVQKGARVLVEMRLPGLAMTGQGVALESGAPGESIRVLNPGSHAVLAAEVIGPGDVRVRPDSVPLQPAGGAQVASQ